ncbi:hypothetical protein [Afipia clevelandensis]|uniref:Uncharacterized protein n=1 Tax=Afipia clevelandensis ATCC 49720 TaxID=883079 RepID=K8P5H4_9BRAD|nr:hypothetical protein [Afipia clevelandensis]EKS37807.1 hypothetical protein HMPREF9696_01757 [Afipia clevelandensis ATCC 49720]
MIRALIEIEGKDDWEHSRQLEAALGKLGFEPKKSEDDIRWQRDLWAALNEEGIDIRKLVEAYRQKVNSVTERTDGEEKSLVRNLAEP